MNKCNETCNKFCFKHHQNNVQEKICITCSNKRNTHLGQCIQCAGGK